MAVAETAWVQPFTATHDKTMTRQRKNIFTLKEGPPQLGPLRSFPPSRKALVWTIVLLGILHLVGVVGTWWPTPDSGLYQSLGRSLAAGEGYAFNGEPSNAVGPGFPLILAGVRLLPGEVGDGFVSPNLLVALCGLGALWMTYVTVGRLGDRRTALAVVLVLGLSYRFYASSHRILSDMPAMLAVWVMLYAALRYQRGRWGWLALAGVMAAAAIAIRIPVALTVGPIAVGLALDRSAVTRRGRRLIVAGVILLLTVAVWRGWMAIAGQISPDTPAYTLKFGGESGVLAGASGIIAWLKTVPFAASENLLETVAEYLTGQELTWLIGLPAVAMMVVGMVVAWRAGRRLMATVFVLHLVGTLFVTGDWAIRERYMLPCMPIFLLAMFEGIGRTVVWTSRLRHVANRPQATLVVVSLLTAMFMAANGPRTVRWAFYFSYLSYTPTRYYEKIAHGDYRELLPACDVVADRGRSDDTVELIGVRRSIVYFLSQRRISDGPAAANGKAIALTGQANADSWLAHIGQPGAAKLLMVDLRGDNDDPPPRVAFREKLQAGLAEMTAAGRLELLYPGLDYQVYRQTDSSGD